MPVTSKYGKRSLDYIGACRGRPFAIETKAPTGSLTGRQETTILNMESAGIAVFVIAGEDAAALEPFLEWLDEPAT
jgi:hypothetical protein